MSKNLKRAFAALLASLGIFAFAGCGTDDKGGNGEGAGSGGSQIENGGSGGGETGGEGGGTVKPEEPAIPTYPEESVNITEAKGDQESAYVIWDKVPGAMGYNVYYKNEAGGDFVKLDAPLVREYKNYCRADAVGLKAGTYTLKVVPLGGEELAEDESKAAPAENTTVTAHERTGYAFVGGTSSGAYNEDGTLKSDANVIYVTDANKDTVELNGIKGLQNILDVQKKAGKPLAIRLIGKVNSPDITESKANNNNKNPNTVLIKGDGKKGNLAVTLEGIGSDATAYGWTLRITSSTNVEVRNIGFMCTKAGEPDGITLEKDDHVWIHDCDLFYGGAGSDTDQAKGDGSLDTKESTNITHSYNHFWDSGKCNLQNMHESGDWRITYHHNWYDHSDSRHPRVRSATVHVYNNYFDGNAKYGVGACEGANIFVENNYFRSTATMKPMLSSMQGTDAKGEGTFSDEDGGMIKAYGNAFVGKCSLITQNDTADKTDIDCYAASSRDEVVPDDYVTKQGGTAYSNFDTAAEFYEYEVDSPEVAKEKVEKYAGRIGGGDVKWEFNDETEDSNYSIIAAFKTALNNYSNELVKVGGIEAGGNTSGGTTGGETGGEGGGTTGGETGGETGGNTPIEGEITVIPTVGTHDGFIIVGNQKANAETQVAGVTVPAGNALKTDSSCNIKFTTVAAMKLYIYVDNEKSVNVNGTNLTPASNVIVVDLAAGDHTIVKGGGENVIYLIKLVPVG